MTALARANLRGKKWTPEGKFPLNHSEEIRMDYIFLNKIKTYEARVLRECHASIALLMLLGNSYTTSDSFGI